MSTEHRGPQAVLSLPRSVKELITYAKKVSLAMDGNAYFPSPDPPLAKLDGAIAALDASETAMGGGLAKTKKRDADRAVVTQGLIYECRYVQSVADQQSNPADAEAVITSAGMFVRKPSKAIKPELSVRPGPVSGTVLLIATAVADVAVYYWQWSTASIGWTSAPETLVAKTTIAGLAPATVHTFRVRALTRAGLKEWSQPITLVVP